MSHSTQECWFRGSGRSRGQIRNIGVLVLGKGIQGGHSMQEWGRMQFQYPEMEVQGVPSARKLQFGDTECRGSP